MDRVIIIAEAGVNHNGSVSLAKKMVDAAKEAGADYVKFQTFVPQALVASYASKAEYQKAATGSDETQLQMLNKLALTKDNFKELRDYCSTVGIGFISTPFDMGSIDFLESFDMDFWKIPSGEVTNFPYLVAMAKTGRKIIMSTGMCNLSEIKDAIEVLESNGADDITLLHCNTQYPTPFDDVNLQAIKTISESTGKPVGYSDHTLGIEIPIAAVAIGASVIEKHFTLDRNMGGPDHKASLTPDELKEMVTSIRNVERAMGNGIKVASKSEEANKTVARKSIVANCKIVEGEKFTEDNLTTKRPGTGISPMRWDEIIGRVSNRNYEKDELIEL